MQFNRREAISLTAAGLAASALAPVSVIAATPKPIPVWAVGTPGEWNWTVVRAISAETAKHEWVAEYWGVDKPADCGKCDCEESFPCEYRELLDGDLEAERREDWDKKDVVAGDAEWFAGGMGAYCNRCNYETSLEEGGHVIGDQVICEDCMKIEDWQVVDPEYAAELLDE